MNIEIITEKTTPTEVVKICNKYNNRNNRFDTIIDIRNNELDITIYRAFRTGDPLNDMISVECVLDGDDAEIEMLLDDIIATGFQNLYPIEFNQLEKKIKEIRNVNGSY